MSKNSFSNNSNSSNTYKSRENVFDLTKIVKGSNQEEVKKSFTKNPSNTKVIDMPTLLLGYTEANPNDWDSIENGSSIRYMRKDGNFRKGGIVKTKTIGTDVKEGAVCLHLASGYGPFSKSWIIYLNDIDKIWVRPSKKKQKSEGHKTMDNIPNTYADDISHLKKQVEQLKIDIVNMNNEQKRIIKLIRKIHETKLSTKK